MQRVEVRRGDVTLSCLEGGDGHDVVVLLHGLAGSAKEWLPTAQSLLPDHRVIAIDQRGHGDSTRRPTDVSRRAYVDDVVAVVKALASDKQVALVGQSMGAHTAMLTAAWHPDLVRRLVMLEGGVGGNEGDDYPGRLGKWFASWPIPFPDAKAAIDFLGSRSITQSWVRDMEEREDGLWPRFDADMMEAAIRPVAETARWAEWSAVTTPILLVRGQKSGIGDDEFQRMLALRTDVEQKVIPDSGHEAHLDQPDLWAAILRRYLEQ
jgi:pimeloyl-ACP methyl ester carboxylesterase